MSILLAIDPGTEESGWVVLDRNNTIQQSGVSPNADMLERIYEWFGDAIAIEMIASYGMPVGAEVFETCVWIGRFIQASNVGAERVYRRDVKIHLCATTQAKDPNIRQALIDIFGAPGTKANPGGTYGVKSHAWAALGVAATVRGLHSRIAEVIPQLTEGQQ